MAHNRQRPYNFLSNLTPEEYWLMAEKPEPSKVSGTNTGMLTLTSMCDPFHYPKADIVVLNGNRWEIEHGFREMKQHMLNNELLLRSKKPELVQQELWGVALAYNL